MIQPGLRCDVRIVHAHTMFKVINEHPIIILGQDVLLMPQVQVLSPLGRDAQHITIRVFRLDLKCFDLIPLDLINRCKLHREFPDPLTSDTGPIQGDFNLRLWYQSTNHHRCYQSNSQDNASQEGVLLMTKTQPIPWEE
jgi:hypothetical protein